MWILRLTLLIIVTTGRAQEARPPFQLVVGKTAWRSGDDITARLRVERDGHYFVAACNTMDLEFFDPERSLWVTQPQDPCPRTEPALTLAAYIERHPTETVIADVDRYTLVRLVMPYGVDCREGYPLELADCRTLDAVISANLSVNPPKDD